MNYTELYQNAFKRPPDQPPSWVHLPFAWGTPEAREVQEVIWSIENRMWKQFLTKVRDEKIAGDLVEFGVSVGGSLEALIAYSEELGLKFNIYGFDSFEGLPEPSPTLDPPYWQKGEFAASYESVSERLKVASRPNLSLVKGWFSDTLARSDLQAKILRVAFARIDCDLYQPAVECLAFLESRLVTGAYLCFDDWMDDPETGETRAFFEFFERTKHKFTFQPVCRIALGGMHMRVFRTRRGALEDGLLVDLSPIEVIRHHWKLPFACTAEVWRMIESTRETSGLDRAVIWRDISATAQRAVSSSKQSNLIQFEAKIADRLQSLKLRLGPDDDAKPVLTLMLPHQN
jgi:hypothetical protein